MYWIRPRDGQETQANKADKRTNKEDRRTNEEDKQTNKSADRKHRPTRRTGGPTRRTGGRTGKAAESWGGGGGVGERAEPARARIVRDEGYGTREAVERLAGSYSRPQGSRRPPEPALPTQCFAPHIARPHC